MVAGTGLAEVGEQKSAEVRDVSQAHGYVTDNLHADHPYQPGGAKYNWEAMSGVRHHPNDGFGFMHVSHTQDAALPGAEHRTISAVEAGDPDETKGRTIDKALYRGDLRSLVGAVKDAANGGEQAKTFLKYLAQEWNDKNDFESRYVDKDKDPEGKGFFEIKLKSDQQDTLRIGTDGSVELNDKPITYDPKEKGVTTNKELNDFQRRLHDLGHPAVPTDKATPLSQQMKGQLKKIDDDLSAGHTKELRNALATVDRLRSSSDPKDQAKAQEWQQMLTQLASGLYTEVPAGQARDVPTYGIYDPKGNTFRIGMTTDVPNQGMELRLKSNEPPMFHEEGTATEERNSYSTGPAAEKAWLDRFNRQYDRFDRRRSL